MGITKKGFGTTKDGSDVTLVTLENKNGMQVSCIDYGAIVVNVIVPDAALLAPDRRPSLVKAIIVNRKHFETGVEHIGGFLVLLGDIVSIDYHLLRLQASSEFITERRRQDNRLVPEIQGVLRSSLGRHIEAHSQFSVR